MALTKQELLKVFETLTEFIDTRNDVEFEPNERGRGNHSLLLQIYDDGSGCLGLANGCAEMNDKFEFDNETKLVDYFAYWLDLKDENKKVRVITAPGCKCCGRPTRSASGFCWQHSDMAKYRLLEAGEIIQPGDQVDNCRDGWRDEPRWEPATSIGQPAPDPKYPAHRQYRRKENGVYSMTDDEIIALAKSCGFWGVDEWWKQELPKFRALIEKSHPTPAVPDACPTCHGTGADPMSDNLNWLPCWPCKGTGKRR